MSGQISYLTLSAPAVAEVEVKRSRFLARAVPVSAEDEARSVVEAARKEHWDARHHCSAFILGPDGGTQRSSDDGEPAGTAGMPMLEVLRGAALSDVVVVVTRWFGGTLLGTGGLVRAYSDAVREALAHARVIERRLVHEWLVTVPMTDIGRVEHAVRARGFDVVGTNYAADAELVVGTPPDGREALVAALAELLQGAVDLRAGETRWVDGPR